MWGLGGPGRFGLGSGKVLLLCLLSSSIRNGGKERKKKGILKKHLCWEAQSAGMAGSALLLAAVLREGDT